MQTATNAPVMEAPQEQTQIANPVLPTTPKARAAARRAERKAQEEKEARAALEASKPLMNPAIRKEFAPVIQGRIAELADAAHIAQIADDLTVIKVNDDNMVPVPLRNFPMAYSRAGRITGKLMNIAQFCQMKTGRAWNDKHAATVLDTTGVKLHVLPNKTEADKVARKTLSEELDALRPQFYNACKSVAAGFIARNDAQVEKARIRQTSRGIVMDTMTIILTGKSSEADKLRAELAKRDALLTAYEQKLGAKMVKQMRKQVDRPIDVAAVLTHQADEPAAPVTT